MGVAVNAVGVAVQDSSEGGAAIRAITRAPVVYCPYVAQTTTSNKLGGLLCSTEYPLPCCTCLPTGHAPILTFCRILVPQLQRTSPARFSAAHLDESCNDGESYRYYTAVVLWQLLVAILLSCW